ncbi:related to Ribonucleases P/MRP protein subunit POP1 [Melanopsichium pennsylvanicum]|uniref:Related to Ribonucleases P/MRP protein subunit POP1 n=2 Tax=Melanopsichium pennsylvanicum TaxID=63383 RepID=A0AAJ4XMF2_9BASI|nr:related to Ribonucleases P/MRP protein subunit POP1 [Melanopsichium pennsylvanicum 4]SNX84952.1 related to Ribonucleases P/MRP protein subunit POP1 [Melanopsichium pennsylvanicum]
MHPQKRSAPSTASSATQSAPPQNGQNWKKRKQERAHTARFIETQHPNVSSSASSSSTASKPSTPKPSLYSAATSSLPTSIELEQLVSSRAFQIQSFIRSIKSAKSATTTRAWQLLPRHARRRAASHNLLRLPTRLRGKAMAELRSSTTQARTRSDIRKRLPSHGVIRATLRRKKLAQRASHPQRRWLETHLWHAKRFRMTTEKGKGKESDQGQDHGRWGFVLPETTMMKSHRASWRSAKEFVTVHDASYTSVFRVSVRMVGPQASSAQHVDTALLEQLRKCLVEAGFANVSQLDGTNTHVINTVLVQNKASPQSSESNRTSTCSSSAHAALAPVRIIMLASTPHFVHFPVQGEVYTHTCKDALIFAHPSADLLIRRALKSTPSGITMIDESKNAISSFHAPPGGVLQAYASQLDSAPDPWLAAGGKDSSLSKLERRRRRRAFKEGSAKAGRRDEMDQPNDSEKRSVTMDEEARLKRQQGYNMFELIGPRAGSLLQAVLKVRTRSGHEADEFKLRHFLDKNVSGSPLMVEVHVNDPRLSYPPKLKILSTTMQEPALNFTSAPSPQDHDSLFTMGSTPPRFSKGEIDSRRALNPIPGARLVPDSRDDIIPVVIIRDQLVAAKPSMDRFTLVVPRGWGMAFFLSLVTTHQSGASSGARVLGQHQLKHQRLELAALASSRDRTKEGSEAGLLSYPHNWLGTQAHAVSEKNAAKKRLEGWGKRPKGKRSEYMFPTHKDWQKFLQSRTKEEVQNKLKQDRIGVARPYPFGGSHHWEWIVDNSERLYNGATLTTKETRFKEPWLVAQPNTITSADTALSASHFASAMVAIRLQAVRKGTVTPQSSLLLPATFSDHLAWIHHLDPVDHPALVLNRTVDATQKTPKQHLKSLIGRRCEIMQLGRSAPQTSLPKQNKTIPGSRAWEQHVVGAEDPEMVHDRCADWNNAIGTVVDGDYSLGNGRGFGLGVVTLKAWIELGERQKRLDGLKEENGEDGDKGRRRARNPIETTRLLLMREPGTDVVRAVSASLIFLM